MIRHVPNAFVSSIDNLNLKTHKISSPLRLGAKSLRQRRYWRSQCRVADGGDVGAKRPSESALGGKSKVKPNGRRRCDGADYETVSPIMSKKV